MKILIFCINLLLSIIIINCEYNIANIETFLDWGLENNLKLSPFIETSEIGKNKIYFIAKTDIEKDKELLTIPSSLTFNVNKALELINLKDLNKQYKEFDKINLPNAKEFIFRKEMSFLSYIFYLINHKQKKYKKTKFFEFYEKYLEILKKYSPKSPLFHGQKLRQIIIGSILYKPVEDIENIYREEINIYNNKTFYKKEMDFEEYTRFRLAIHKYGQVISNHWTLIPFLNYFDDNYIDYNANMIIKQNNDVKIVALKDIKKGEQIILKAPKKTNMISYIIEGKTDEKLVDYYINYSVTAFSPALYKKYEISTSDIHYFKDNFVNILEENFDRKFVDIYKKHAKLLKGDGTDIWAYGVAEMDLKFYKILFESVTLDTIYEYYDDIDDRINMERIIRGERNLIVNAYNKINNILNKLLEEERQKSKKIQKGNNSEL